MRKLSHGTEPMLAIGPGITMTFLCINRRQVRIGIEAPPSVMVDRTEIRQRKLQGGQCRPPR